MKFKLGDHVRVIARTDWYFDMVGIVVRTSRNGVLPKYIVNMGDVELYYDAHELILADPEPHTATASKPEVAEGVEVPGVDFECCKTPPSDQVKHPSHYTSHPSGIECIQVTEHMGFNLGNAIKYVWRADLKADALEDLRKAIWYIDREIQKREQAA